MIGLADLRAESHQPGWRQGYQGFIKPDPEPGQDLKVQVMGYQPFQVAAHSPGNAKEAHAYNGYLKYSYVGVEGGHGNDPG